MTIGILGGNCSSEDYFLLDRKLNELIEIKGTYLFNILCGKGSLGELWGKNNGAGVQYFFGDFDGFIKRIDYAFVFQNAGVSFNPVLAKLKKENVHGTVIIRS